MPALCIWKRSRTMVAGGDTDAFGRDCRDDHEAAMFDGVGRRETRDAGRIFHCRIASRRAVGAAPRHCPRARARPSPAGSAPAPARLKLRILARAVAAALLVG